MAYDSTIQLQRMIERARLILNEPDASVKYTDAQVISFIRTGWEVVLQDLLNVADQPIVVRMDLVVTTTPQVYQLPPNVGEVLSLAKILTDTDQVLWEILPRSRWNPFGPGVTFEGNTIRFSPSWQGTDTLRFTYIPNGDLDLHYATDGSLTADTSITFSSSPGTGSLDKRPNAYAGSVVRIFPTTTSPATWDGGVDVVQERIVTAYNAGTRVATLAPSLSPSVGSPPATVSYEVVPFLANLLEHVVTYYAAIQMIAIEADRRKLQLVEREYNKQLRALKLRHANFENRIGDRFVHDTIQNRNYSAWSYGTFGEWKA